MKLRILVLFLVCCLKAEAQSNSVEANSNIYQRAFEYIKQDSINVGINIAVSDSIVDLDWNGFDGLDEYKDENADLHVFNLQYLYNNDWYIWGECIEYLFLLDENGHCKKVLKHRVILN